MRSEGWKRVGIVALALWWLFWVASFFIAQSQRDHSIAVDEAVTGEKWTAATINPLVIDAQVQMNQAVLAIITPLAIAAVVYAVRWVAAGFWRRPSSD